MSSYLFTWNPKKWKWFDLSQAVYETNVEGFYRNVWTCGTTRKIEPGDRAFLMRLGVPPKGIMGSGEVVSHPYKHPHWDSERAKRGDLALGVDIDFDVLNETPILVENVLRNGELAGHNWFPQASGTMIPESIATKLETIWFRITGKQFEQSNNEERSFLHTEGKRRNRLIKTYERNPKAREDCIRSHGIVCSVCDLNFEDKYGDIGRGFIHVHHIVPVSKKSEEYKIDPFNDLRPVCPNCHAMLHKRTPPYGIEELKELMR
jgi:5-methylcytosine-specific restriction protein A